jgi:hypothetical protein
MASVVPGQHPQAQQQAEQVNGVDAREPSLPEAHPVQFAGPRPRVVVVGQHEAREQDEVAHRNVAGVDHRRHKTEPVGIGKVEEDDVDSRKTAQPSQRIQSCWFLCFHFSISSLWLLKFLCQRELLSKPKQHQRIKISQQLKARG